MVGAMRLPLVVLHVSAGTVAMLAGALAIASRKGSRGHRRAGNVFVICMLSVSALGSYLGFIRGKWTISQAASSAFISWQQRGQRPKEEKTNSGRKPNWIAPPIALAFAAINFVWGVEVARGLTAVKNQSSVGAYVFFGTLALLSAAGNVRMLLRARLSGTQRLVRHLWRMCFRWFIATISFFLGQQQVFPAWLRGSYVLMVLAFLPLVFLIFWFIRVRLRTRTLMRGWHPAAKKDARFSDRGLLTLPRHVFESLQ